MLNVKQGTSDEEWIKYALWVVEWVAKLGTRGFAFNMLTSYSGPEHKRTDLYYADPAFFFDHCMHNYGPRVALLHDYGLFEFTILVHRDP